MLKLLATLVAISLVGCDSTDVEGSFMVAFSGYVSSTTFSRFDDIYECRFVLGLRASGGEEGDFGTWLGGYDEILYDEGGQDHLTLSADDLLNIWGQGRISFGEIIEVERMVTSTSEFSVRQAIDIRFRDGSTVSKTADINC